MRSVCDTETLPQTAMSKQGLHSIFERNVGYIQLLRPADWEI